MEFILTSLESTRLGAATAAAPAAHHYPDNLDRHRIQESFDAFAEALRQFVLNLHDNENETEAHTPPAGSSQIITQTITTPPTTTLPKPPSSLASATWLYETCSRVPSPLPTLQLALEVLSAANNGKNDLAKNKHSGQLKHIGDDNDNDNNDGNESSKMQSSLFELFGEGEQSIEALFEVMEKLDSIRKDITEDDLRVVAKRKGEGGTATITTSATTTASTSTQRLQHLQQLRAEAYEAVNMATALRTDLHSTMMTTSTNFASRGTHSVSRKSDKDAEKSYKRAFKLALTALNKAREAGALTEFDDTLLKDQLSINTSSSNSDHTIASAMEQMMLRNEEAMLFNSQNARGLDGMTKQQIANMKHNLLPEGTRQYNDGNLRGLPPGTEREIKEGQYEKVTIPAHILDKSMLRNRINLDEVLGKDTDERAAFVGTQSLNPMQSTVFEAAYNTRENLLICAPTGKGAKEIYRILSIVRPICLLFRFRFFFGYLMRQIIMRASATHSIIFRCG